MSLWPVDQQQRPTSQSYVAGIRHEPRQLPAVIAIILLAVLLLNQHLVVATVPHPGPRLVCPTETKASGPAWVGQDILYRALEQAAPSKPIVVYDKPGDPKPLGEESLLG